MRMKILKAVRAVANEIQVLLQVRLPMSAANGLRTRSKRD
jgi:hypothetical protein